MKMVEGFFNNIPIYETCDFSHLFQPLDKISEIEKPCHASQNK